MSHHHTKTRSAPTLLLAGLLAALFLFTAFIGVWTAYDRSGAWRGWLLIAAGLAAAALVVVIGRRGGKRALGLMSAGMVLLAAAIAAYFLLSYDFSAATGTIAALDRIGQWLQANRPSIALPEDINANVAASGLAISLSLGLGSLLWAIRERLGLLLLVLVPLWLLGLAALVLAQSRGAWLGMAAGLLAIAYLLLRRRVAGQRGLAVLLDLLALAAVASLAVFFVAAVRSPAVADTLGAAQAGAGAVGRASLWRDGLDLVADYPFTGSGLRSTMMVYSTYGMLLHVGFISHMHNLFLQIAIEQGVPALLVFAGLLAVAAANVLAATRRGRPGWRFGLAAGASLSVLAVQGMVDAGIYVSWMTPVLFLPIGFALALDPGRSGRRDRRVDWSLALAALLAGVLALVAFLPAGRAALLTNLGAVAQTRAELSVYTWPEWPIQDELRRAPQVNLGPALARYDAALALDPDSASANRRLGQIELSRGAYDPAHAHLADAFASNPNSRATRQLLAESYAIAGDLDTAAELLATVDTGNGQLDARIFWYEHIGEPERAERMKQAAEAGRYHDE